MVKPKPIKFKTTNEKQEIKKHIDAIAPHLTDIQKWDQVVERALSPPDTSALEKQIRELEITNESLKAELDTDGESLVNANIQIQKLLAENESYKNDFEKHINCVNELNVQILQLRSELADRNVGVGEHKAELIKPLEDELVKAKAEINSLRDLLKVEREVNIDTLIQLEEERLRVKSLQALNEVEHADLVDAKKTVVVQNQLIAVFRMIFMSRHVNVGPKEMEELLLQANDGYRQSNEEFITKMLKVVEFVNKFQEDPRVERHYNNLLEGRKDLDKHHIPKPILFTEALDYATCVDEMRANINGLFVLPVNKDPKANKMEKEEIENQIIRSIRISPEEFRQKMLKDTAGLKEFLKTQDKTQPAHAGALEDAMRLEKIIQETPSKDTIESSKLDKQD